MYMNKSTNACTFICTACILGYCISEPFLQFMTLQRQCVVTLKKCCPDCQTLFMKQLILLKGNREYGFNGVSDIAVMLSVSCISANLQVLYVAESASVAVSVLVRNFLSGCLACNSY